MKYLTQLLSFILRIFGLSETKKDKLAVQQAVQYWQNQPIRDWDAAFLRSKRSKTDPTADRLINTIFTSEDPQVINHFYNSIQRTSEELPEELPQEVKDYFKQGENLPAWANKALLKRGEEFYIEHGPMIAMVLCAKSLPECYACANGAKVLYQTGRLSEKNGSLNAFTRRIAETAQFIVNVMSPKALSPSGKGIRSAQKVRLIHAAIRYYIHKTEWDSKSYGEPINQEDMAGTLMSFAPLVLEGLEKLGVEISMEDKEAYVHCWRVVGHYMGLDEDLLPNNVEDSFKLGYAIFNDQKKASEEGKALTKSLIDFMTFMSPDGELGLIVDDILRLMLGEDTADLLGVPKVSKKSEIVTDKLTKRFLGGWQNFEDRHALLREFSGPINKLLLNGMLKKMNGGEKIHFFIPLGLQDEWDLDTNANTK